MARPLLNLAAEHSVMKLSKITLLAPLVVLFGSVAQAHPGHDGHELVWEYTGGHIHLDWLIWTTVAVLAASTFYRYAKKQS